MIALLGPPPKELINREEKWSKVKWERAFPSAGGKLCWTAREYYGGPFFNAKGMLYVLATHISCKILAYVDTQVNFYTKTLSLPTLTSQIQLHPSMGKINNCFLTLRIICFSGCQKIGRPRGSC